MMSTQLMGILAPLGVLLALFVVVWLRAKMRRSEDVWEAGADLGAPHPSAKKHSGGGCGGGCGGCGGCGG